MEEQSETAEPRIREIPPVNEDRAAHVLPRPSVGRIVHYQSYGTPNGEFAAEARAAVITAVAAPGAPVEDLLKVDLCVLNPTGLFFNRGVRFSIHPAPGCWSWPPRV